MAKHTGLLLSSLVASALVSLAAAPAQAQTAFEWAEQLVTNVTPEANAWGMPCAITWGDPDSGVGYSAITNGACLFTQSLKKSDPTITNSLLTFWWGSANPASNAIHDYIVAENHFENIDFALVQSGDVLASKYTAAGGDTGYLMIVANSEFVGLVGGAELYLVQVYDSTRSPHGDTDTRWNADQGSHDHGVGVGFLYVDANAAGEIVGHTWSTPINGSYYTPQQRHLVAGRFVR